MTEKLIGKFAAITGAASGIGLAATEALLAEGATVVMVDRDEQALAELTKNLAKKQFRKSPIWLIPIAATP